MSFSFREQAALDQALAAGRENRIAAARLSLEAAECAAAIQSFVTAVQQIEGAALFAHPDVMELDLADAAWDPQHGRDT